MMLKQYSPPLCFAPLMLENLSRLISAGRDGILEKS